MTSPTLAQRMLAVNKSLGWVEKSGKNKEQNYAYVQAVDIFAEARAAYNDAGVIFQWSVTDQHVTVLPREGKSPQLLTELKGDYAFINADDKNDVIAGAWAGQSMDVGDKGTWKAITGSLKYVLIGNHLLPTGDDPETDGAEPVVKPASATPAGNRDTSKPKTETAATTGLTDKQKALLHARFRDLGIVEKASKQHILVKLTGKHATAQMSTADLDTFIEFFKEKTDATEALVIEAMAAA